MPGSISASRRFTPGVRRGRGKRSAMPAHLAATTRKSNCATPETQTVQAKTWPGTSAKKGSTATSAQTKHTLNRIERQSVVYGKRVSLRVDTGGRRIIQKK